MRNKKQMMIDLGMLIVIMIAIYYLKVKSGSDMLGPFEGLQAILGLN